MDIDFLEEKKEEKKEIGSYLYLVLVSSLLPGITLSLVLYLY